MFDCVPDLPIRWRYVSPSLGKSKFITTFTAWMSIPLVKRSKNMTTPNILNRTNGDNRVRLVCCTMTEGGKEFFFFGRQMASAYQCRQDSGRDHFWSHGKRGYGVPVNKKKISFITRVNTSHYPQTCPCIMLVYCMSSSATTLAPMKHLSI